jgi:hypothetical protein
MNHARNATPPFYNKVLPIFNYISRWSETVIIELDCASSKHLLEPIVHYLYDYTFSHRKKTKFDIQ